MREGLGLIDIKLHLIQLPEQVVGELQIRLVNLVDQEHHLLRKPLLIKGEPGTGKTMLAEAVAKALGKRLIIWNIKSTTKAQEGLYVYDTIQRLYDGQFGEEGVNDIARSSAQWQCSRWPSVPDLPHIPLFPEIPAVPYSSTHLSLEIHSFSAILSWGSWGRLLTARSRWCS